MMRFLSAKDVALVTWCLCLISAVKGQQFITKLGCAPILIVAITLKSGMERYTWMNLSSAERSILVRLANSGFESLQSAD